MFINGKRRGKVNAKFINNSFAGNKADSLGGFLYTRASAFNEVNLDLFNTVAWGNSSGLESDTIFNVNSQHSLVQDTLFPGAGNLDGTDTLNNP